MSTVIPLHRARSHRGAEHPSLQPAHPSYLHIERTFMFIDLGGFSGYTRRNGPASAAALLSEFRATTRSVASWRGVRVAKWLGDGAMLIGVDTTPSVALGAHLIARFADSDIHVRVGLATGDALLFEGDDYIGEPVNLAARLCGLAGPGEILAHCDPADVPDWVSVDGNQTVTIRGVGEVTGVLRLQPG